MKKLICIILLSLFWGEVASAENIPVLKCSQQASNQFTHNLQQLSLYKVSKISKSLIHYSYKTKSYFWDGEYNRDTGKLNLKAFKNKEKNILLGKYEANCQEEVEKIISDAERYRIVKEKNTNTAWKVDSKFIKPECFHIIRFGGGGGAEWYKKYFNEYFGEPVGRHTDNPTFVSFIVDVGKYLNKKVPLKHTISTGWDGTDWIGEYFAPKISITRSLEKCLSEKPETKVKYTGGNTLEYKVVKSLDINMGKILAPHIKKNFESIKQVEVLDWGGGSMPAQDHVNTYGILELEGEKFILPLKNDVYIFR